MKRAVAGLLACLLLAGCGATPQTPRAAVSAWVRDSGFAEAVTTLVGDAARVHADVTSKASPGDLRRDCSELANNAQGANNELVTPDRQLTEQLSFAYGHLTQFAARCVASAADPARLARLDGTRRAALGALVAGVLRAEDVLGRSLHVDGVP
jgi:hypothetical protein